jgi:hypothetical protein
MDYGNCRKECRVPGPDFVGGEVVRTDPKFIAECSDAEVYFHSTLEKAIEDAESEFSAEHFQRRVGAIHAVLTLRKRQRQAAISVPLAGPYGLAVLSPNRE